MFRTSFAFPARRHRGPEPAFPRFLVLAAVGLIVLLAVFYGGLVFNMNAINVKVKDLKEHPYPVTVAAGKVETALMQVRTLDAQLLYVDTPEALREVEREYQRISDAVQEPLQVIGDRYLADPSMGVRLKQRFGDLTSVQQELVALTESGAADPQDIDGFVEQRIEPLVEELLVCNSSVLEGSAESFDNLYDLADRAFAQTIGYAGVLTGVVLVAAILFMVIIGRNNRQQALLHQSLERALEAAQDANTAKSRFLSNMSHDIRTPLTAIIGLTEIAADNVNDPKRVGECLDKVTCSSHHLLGLINDVLDMSKIESGQITVTVAPFDLCGFVDDLATVVQPQATAKGVGLSVECRIGTRYVVGDEVHVSQVLVNLLGNAIKYTEPGGSARLLVEDVPGRRAVSERNRVDEAGGVGPKGGWILADPSYACEKEQRFRFVVEDTGIGMSPEFARRVFEPFERESIVEERNIEGTGLGMSIAKTLVERLGGSIELESEPGRGSTFTVEIPLGVPDDEARFAEEFESRCSCGRCDDGLRGAPACRDAVAPCGTAGDVDDADGASARLDAPTLGARVLLVEDDELNAEVAKAIIGGFGVEVDHVWDGLEAVETVRRAAPDRYALIFMDVQMPRMDGLTAARTMHAEARRDGRKLPPLIAMTANAYVEDRRKAREAGMDGYAAKPFDRRELHAILEEQVLCKARAQGGDGC